LRRNWDSSKVQVDESRKGLLYGCFILHSRRKYMILLDDRCLPGIGDTCLKNKQSTEFKGHRKDIGESESCLSEDTRQLSNEKAKELIQSIVRTRGVLEPGSTWPVFRLNKMNLVLGYSIPPWRTTTQHNSKNMCGLLIHFDTAHTSDLDKKLFTYYVTSSRTPKK